MHDDAYLELCSAHALGSLDPADAARLQAHLASGCVPCEEELALHRDTVERMGKLLPAQGSPAGTEARLMARIEEGESTGMSAPGPTVVGSVGLFPLWARRIAAVLAFGIVGWIAVDRGLKLAELSSQVANLQKSTTDIQRVVASYELRGTEHAPEAVGYAYAEKHKEEDPADDELIVHVSKLEQCEEGKVYTAWAVSDGQIEEVGTLRPDELGKGYSTLRMPSYKSPFQIQLTLENVTHEAAPAGPVMLRYTPAKKP